MSPSAWWWRAVEKWSWNTHLRSCDHIGHPEIIILRYFKYNLTLCQKTSTFWVLQSCPAGNSSKPFGILTEKKTGWTNCQTSWWSLLASWIWFWGFYSRHFQVFFPGFWVSSFAGDESPTLVRWSNCSVPNFSGSWWAKGLLLRVLAEDSYFFTSLWFWYHLPISL